MSIPVAWCLGGRELAECRWSPDGRVLGYLSMIGGSSALMVDALDGQGALPWTTAPMPRSCRAMGGGVWDWTPAGDVVMVAADGRLWLIPRRGEARRLADALEGRSLAAPRSATSDAGGARIVVAVDEAEVWEVLVDDGSARRLDDGRDEFCFDPVPWPGGGARWIGWSAPLMPWDGAQVRGVDGHGGRVDHVAVDGAVQQPRPWRDGTMLAISDRHGWRNLCADGVPVIEERCEHAGPPWGQGARSYAPSPDGEHVAFTRNDGGFGRLCVWSAASGAVTEVGRGVHTQLDWSERGLAALRSGACTPPQLVVYEGGARTVVARGGVHHWHRGVLREPRLAEIPGPAGGVPVRIYDADEPADRVLVWIHGGPTDQWPVSFLPRLAYWRAAGYTIVVPDHRGSAGHGRAFEQALHGQWGVADVVDVAEVVHWVQHGGLGERSATRRAAVFVIGASAGGFTALGVARRADVELAGVIAAYPVSDLVDLAERSHRFERHYTDSLVGPLPAATATMRSRSPLGFAAELTRQPVLLFHGDADEVVPVGQSVALADALRAAGGDVELVVYEGAGHGWRQPEHTIDEYRRCAEFFDRYGGRT